MTRVNVKEARAQFSKLLDHVKAGAEVAILRRGTEVARLVPPAAKPFPLGELAKLRALVKVKGKASSRQVVEMRRQERY